MDVRKTGCHGFCERGPIIVNHPEESCYFQIKPEDVPEIVSQAIKEKKIVERLLYTDPNTNEKIITNLKSPSTRIKSGSFSAPTVVLIPRASMTIWQLAVIPRWKKRFSR